MKYLLTFAVLLALASPALAQLEDNDYVTKFFGTTAAFAFDKQLPPDSGWWGDLLPAELTTDNSPIIKIVNDLRTKNKVQPLLGADEFVFLWGQEGTDADGKYYYTIDFQGLRPSEVTFVLDAYGGVKKLVPGSTMTFWPLNKRNFYFTTLDPSEPISCFFGGTELSIKPEQTVAAVKQQVQQVLSAKFGTEMALDIFLSQYLHADGGGGAELSVNAEIPTDLVPVLQYALGGEMPEGE